MTTSIKDQETIVSTEEKCLPVSADQPTVFVSALERESSFDVQPLLKALEWQPSDDMAKHLDNVMMIATEHYMKEQLDGGRELYTLRLLRNALLTGGGWINFEQ